LPPAAAYASLCADISWNDWKTAMIVDLIAAAIGAIGAIVYVGFFAYKVPSAPLAIIVIFVLCLMLYSFYDEMRGSTTAGSRTDEVPPTA
jgi:hypothetical protein